MENERAGEAQGIAPRKHSTSLEDEGCSEIEDCYHETAPGLCTTIPFLGLTVTGSCRLEDSLSLSYLPRRSPGPGRLPRTMLGARRRLYPGPASRAPPASMRKATSGLSGRTRLRTWASGMAAEPARAQPRTFASARSPVRSSARGSAQAAARREAGSSRGDGERGRARHHEGENGGRAGPRAAAVLTRAGQCGYPFILAKTRSPALYSRGRGRAIPVVPLLAGPWPPRRCGEAAPPRDDGIALRSPRASSPAHERPLRRGRAARQRPKRAVGGGHSRPRRSPPGCGGGESASGRAESRRRRCYRRALLTGAASPASCSRRLPAELLGSARAPGLAPPPNSSSGSDRKHDLIIVLARAQHFPPSTPRPPRFPPLARRPVNS